ncbi:MAG: hypothetical protein MK108_00055 [Mariniblastus sp.]|nr:hypothetical protein [Mariniblastus sp.]
MDPSASPITASMASPLVSQDVAAHVRNRQNQLPQLKETGNPISDTLEAQDREPDGNAARNNARQPGKGEAQAGPATGDLLDLTG